MTEPHSDALVLFGATGDLAYEQIFPALQAMTRRGHLDVPVIGVAMPDWTVEQLRARAQQSIAAHGSLDPEAFGRLAARLSYVAGDYQEPATFATLRRVLGSAQRPLFYLAIPPSLFGTVASGLARSGSAAQARVIVEKPFGRDLASAKALNSVLHESFREPAVYRIDHFLGKEPVQNLLYFRRGSRSRTPDGPGCPSGSAPVRAWQPPLPTCTSGSSNRRTVSSTRRRPVTATRSASG